VTKRKQTAKYKKIKKPLPAAAKKKAAGGAQALQAARVSEPASSAANTGKKHLGKVYKGKTKYIDPEPKPRRNYVVVKENPRGNVGVAKLKSIKKFDKDNKNADPDLVEINQTQYGLENRTGVDRHIYGRNRMSGKPLKVDEGKVFETPEQFELGSHDLHRVLKHTRKKNRDDN
jgi:hypothetical protein